MNFFKIKMFVQKLVIALVLIGLGVIGTWATMTILNLREANAQLEERVNELKVTKTILEVNKQVLEQENESLQNLPVR